MMELIQQCVSEIKKLKRAVFLIISRGRTTTQVIDSGLIRTVQGNLGNEQTRDNTPMVQQYGFASNPPPATDFVMACIAGDRSNSVIIGTNNQTYIIKNLGNGSVALYDMFGNSVVLNSGGISMVSPGTINISGENVVIHANQTLKYDANGNGTEFTSNTRTDYVIGSTGSSEPIHPPAVP